jgi:hypothetical protein
MSVPGALTGRHDLEIHLVDAARTPPTNQKQRP